MMFKKIKVYAVAVWLFKLFFSTAYADEIALHVPITDDSPRQYVFFHELLSTALEDSGHTLKLIPEQLPQLRIKNHMDHGKISIYWALENNEADKKYIPIKVGLTEGLIGKRVLLIKKEDQSLYDGVKNLNDFKKLDLVAGMGRGWFDALIWKENHLKYKERSGNWKSIFKMIPYGRDYNYISRGVNEIIAEARQYPDLAIEEKLVFIYDRDFRFYLSKTGENAGAKYRDVIELAMQKAKESGLIKRLVRKYWSNHFHLLNYNSRVKIHLQMPQQ